MPTAIAYRRAPLVDPALVPLSDAAVHADGLQKQLTDLALGLVDLNRMSPLDAALATKLGGYTETPPFPDVEAAAGLLPNEPERFAALLRAASMLAPWNVTSRPCCGCWAACAPFWTHWES